MPYDRGADGIVKELTSFAESCADQKSEDNVDIIIGCSKRPSFAAVRASSRYEREETYESSHDTIVYEKWKTRDCTQVQE